MKKNALNFTLLLLVAVLQLSGIALADDPYQKKGYFDPPEKGDHIYKNDAGYGLDGDQKCLLCHVDYRDGKPPYKEWDWKDKYSLNSNGKAFRDSGYQQLMVPGTSPFAKFLPEQQLKFKVKNHEEAGYKFGRGAVEREGKQYKAQWIELEPDGDQTPWHLTPGYTLKGSKEIKFKEMWMKYDPETGRGDHWGKLEIKVETAVEVIDKNGKPKNEKREVKFEGQFMGYNSGSDGRQLKGKIWTTGLGKDSYAPEFGSNGSIYYDTDYFVEKTLKTLWGEYSFTAEKPWVMEHSELGMILTPDIKVTGSISNATWSVEFRKRWNGVNVHNNFVEDTMKCAACHSSHRAPGEKLIGRKTETVLCTLCHDGTGSNYNVLGGLIGNKYESAAGPIDKEVSRNASTTEKAVEIDKATSKHEVKYTTLLSSSPGGSDKWMGDLRCSSCHNPHGTTNFRSLRVTPNPYNWHEYGGDNRIEVKAEITYTGGKVGTPETINYLTGMTEFCSSCHVDYQAGPGGGTDPYHGNPMFNNTVLEPETYGTRRHAMYVDGNDNTRYLFDGNETTVVGDVVYPLKFESMQKVPAAFGGEKGAHIKDSPAIMCGTCHFAHGTPVSNQNSEGKEAIAGGATKEWYDKGLGSTMLLRAPGRGVCVACHKKNEVESPYINTVESSYKGEGGGQ